MSSNPSDTPTRHESRSEVSILVFKDNFAARSFQVPLAWISRVGFVFGTVIFLTLIASFLAIKFYRAAHRTDPTHVSDLEQEISELKMKTRATQESQTPATKPLPQTPLVAGSAPVPAPTVTVTVTPAPMASAPITPIATSGPPTLFSAFPRSVQDLRANASALPITLTQPRARWRGKSLAVSFNIQHSGAGGGTPQQGRIIILARGTESLFAYPEGVLSAEPGESLVNPDRGETFSVSRFREVKAEFGPVRTTNQLKSVEILILNDSSQLILSHHLIPEVPAAHKPGVIPSTSSPIKPSEAAKPSGSATPSASGNDIIEPGVDQ